MTKLVHNRPRHRFIGELIQMLWVQGHNPGLLRGGLVFAIDVLDCFKPKGARKAERSAGAELNAKGAEMVPTFRKSIEHSPQ